MGITTHVLDTAQGRPAVGVPVTLEHFADRQWSMVGRGTTDSDGRLKTLLGERELEVGTYRLTFDTETYFGAQHVDYFFPSVPIIFTIHDASQHHHVPLLLSPFGFSTYRGS